MILQHARRAAVAGSVAGLLLLVSACGLTGPKVTVSAENATGGAVTEVTLRLSDGASMGFTQLPPDQQQGHLEHHAARGSYRVLATWTDAEGGLHKVHESVEITGDTVLVVRLLDDPPRLELKATPEATP